MKKHKLTKTHHSLLDSKTFCVRPFNSLYIGVDGRFKFCCVDRGNREEKIPSHQNISNTNLVELFNSKEYQIIRTKLLNDIAPKTCTKCFYLKENTFLDSNVVYGSRIPASYCGNSLLFNNYIENFENIMNVQSIGFIELWFENKCNLKCRMCSPYCSNQIIQEWAGIVNSNDFMKKNFRPSSFETQNWIDKEESWINLFNLIYEIFKNNHDHKLTLIMAGGEPILSDGMYKVLNFCIEKNIAKNIFLDYKTNLTVVPEKLLTLWKHFQKIRLNISVDGYDKTFEYIRYPGKWEKLLNNIEIVKKYTNVRIIFACTLQVYNVLSIMDLYKWCLNSNIQISIGLTGPLLYPSILDVRVLPNELKKIAIERLLYFYRDNENDERVKSEKQQFLWFAKYLYSEDMSHLFEDFIKFTRHIDKTRNQNIIDIMPEIENYL